MSAYIAQKSNSGMKAFHNHGWEYFGKCQEIMYSSTACDSHVYCPTTAMQPTFQNEADEDSITAVETTAPKIVMNNEVIDNQSIATGSTADHMALVMDINNYSKPSVSAPGKHPHSLMTANSNPQLLSASLTPTSDSMSITTPESNPPAKK